MVISDDDDKREKEAFYPTTAKNSLHPERMYITGPDPYRLLAPSPGLSVCSLQKTSPRHSARVVPSPKSMSVVGALGRSMFVVGPTQPEPLQVSTRYSGSQPLKGPRKTRKVPLPQKCLNLRPVPPSQGARGRSLPHSPSLVYRPKSTVEIKKVASPVVKPTVNPNQSKKEVLPRTRYNYNAQKRNTKRYVPYNSSNTATLPKTGIGKRSNINYRPLGTRDTNHTKYRKLQ